MQALIIKSSSSEKLQFISNLIERLGDHAIEVNLNDYEDFAFGAMMQKERTGKNVSRKTIMKILRPK